MATTGAQAQGPGRLPCIVINNRLFIYRQNENCQETLHLSMDSPMRWEDVQRLLPMSESLVDLLHQLGMFDLEKQWAEWAEQAAQAVPAVRPPHVTIDPLPGMSFPLPAGNLAVQPHVYAAAASAAGGVGVSVIQHGDNPAVVTVISGSEQQTVTIPKTDNTP
jgi:hypothetical protein